MEGNLILEYEITNGYGIADEDYYIITANEELYQFIGLGISKLCSLMEIIHPVDIDDFCDTCNNLKLNQREEIVIRMRRCDNTYRWMLLDIARKENDCDGNITEYFEMHFSDIRALKKENDKLKRIEEALGVSATQESDDTKQKLFDDSSLVDRAKIREYCEYLSSPERKLPFAVIIGTINNLDIYEENEGKEFVDELCGYTREVILEFVHSRGIVSEVDDSKFCIVAEGINIENDLRAFLTAMRTKVAWKYNLIDPSYNITFTFSAVRVPENSGDLDIIFKKLDKAWGIAVAKKKNCYVIYKDHLHGVMP